MEGKDLRDKYPEGADPYVLGEAALQRLPMVMTQLRSCRRPSVPCVPLS